MNVFACPSCGNEVWFDSLDCELCRADFAYEPSTDRFGPAVVPCRNRTTVERCNWTSTADDGWCASCALDVDHEPDPRRQPFQLAKRRTMRQLRRHGLDPAGRAPQLRFDLRAGTPDLPVTTGHQDGLITLDTAEADPAHREEIRTSLGEPYRTPLGHVRHELGHWWWASAVGVEIGVESFRQQFGDERTDYQAALDAHYSSRDDGTWRTAHVSFYAASHPWEDFAESFAHVLHIDDTFETAQVRGVVHGLEDAADFRDVHAAWVPLALTLNEINRSMGTPDPYPFVVSPSAVDKIDFVARSLFDR